MMTPFYDPLLTYADNYERGPFGDFADGLDVDVPETPPQYEVFGHQVHRPFGIPAGPLLNAAYCSAAFRNGYDVNVYKTVRSCASPAHAFPNTLAVHVNGPLSYERATRPVLANDDYTGVTSITNSFGVPSRDPDEWQPDMADAVWAAGHGQVLIGSFQGTRTPGYSGTGEAALVADHARTALLVRETGAPILELNLSCPNEGSAGLLCFDPRLVAAIALAVKDAIGDVPLVLKLAYFEHKEVLKDLVSRTRGIVDGYAAVNTIPARVINRHGRQALPGAGRDVSGVCGAAIAWAGLEMVSRLARLREVPGGDYSIFGVGGVRSPHDYLSLRDAGADVVMSATGAMFEPGLGSRVREVRDSCPDRVSAALH
jgi:hypothetical protein